MSVTLFSFILWGTPARFVSRLLEDRPAGFINRLFQVGMSEGVERGSECEGAGRAGWVCTHLAQRLPPVVPLRYDFTLTLEQLCNY